MADNIIKLGGLIENAMDTTGRVVDASKVKYGEDNLYSEVESIKKDIKIIENSSIKRFEKYSDMQAAIDSGELKQGQLCTCLTEVENAEAQYIPYIVNKNSDDILEATILSGGSSSNIVMPTFSIQSVEIKKAGSNDFVTVSDITKNIECKENDTLKIYFTLDSFGNENLDCKVTYLLGQFSGNIPDLLVKPSSTKVNECIFKIPTLESAVYNLTLFSTVGNYTSNKCLLPLEVGSLALKSTFDATKTFKSGDDITIPINVKSPNRNDKVLAFLNLTKLNGSTVAVFEGKQVPQGDSNLVISSEYLDSTGIYNIELYLKNKDLDDKPDSIVLNYKIVVAEPNIVYIIPESDVNVITDGQYANILTRFIQLGYEKSEFSCNIEVEKITKRTEDGDIETTVPVSSTTKLYPSGESLITLNQLSFDYDNIDGTMENESASMTNYTSYLIKILALCKDSNVSGEGQFVISVFENNFNIQPVNDTSLIHWFSARGKSNNDIENYSIWEDKKTGRTDIAHLNNFNWTTNGWDDSTGDTALSINSGAYVELDITPFLNDIGFEKEGYSSKMVGGAMTISIDFETENILNSEAKVISCLREQPGTTEFIYYLRDGFGDYVEASTAEFLDSNGEYLKGEAQDESGNKYYVEYENNNSEEQLFISTNNVINYFRYYGGYCWIDGVDYSISPYVGLLTKDGELPYTTTNSSDLSKRQRNYNLGDPNPNYSIENKDYKKCTAIENEVSTVQTGFYIDTENAVVSHPGSPADIMEKFHLNFSENTRTRIDLIINRIKPNPETNDDIAPYYFSSIIGYVNGVLSLMEKLENTNKLEHNGKIYLGCKGIPDTFGNIDVSDTGKCSIYDLKIYNRALTPNEILQNYIASIPDIKEKERLMEVNAIDVNGNDVDNSSQNQIPEITFIGYLKEEGVASTSTMNTFIGQLAAATSTQVKELKNIKEPAYVQFSEWKDADGKNLMLVPVRLQFQGTSSMVYPIKNFKFKCHTGIKQNGTKFEYEGKQKFNLGNNISEQTFCLKVDYMDSSHCNNTGTANFIANYNKLITGDTPATAIDPNIRTTIFGKPVLIYYRLHPNDTEKKFIGVGNLNLDKSCTTSFGMKDSIDGGDYTYNFNEVTYMDDDFDSDILVRSEYAGDISLLEETEERLEIFYKHDIVEGILCKTSDSDNYVAVKYENKYYSIRRNEIKETDDGYVLEGDYEVLMKNPKSGNNVCYLTKNGKIRALDGTEVSNVICAEFKANSGKSGAGGFGTYDINAMVSDLELRQPDDGDIEDENYAFFDSTVGKDYPLSFAEFKNPFFYQMQRMIKWVVNSTDNFVTDLDLHFNRNYLLDYYLTISLIGGVDSLGKNLMVGSWGSENKLYITTESSSDSLKFKFGEQWLTPILDIKNGVYEHAKNEKGLFLYYDEKYFDRWTNKFKKSEYKTFTEDMITTKPGECIWYPTFYDIDTIGGLDNAGHLIFDVDIEMEDKLKDGTAVFNTSDSNLWGRVRTLLGEEDSTETSILSRRWDELRNKLCVSTADDNTNTVFSEKNLIGKFYYENQISKIPEKYYNLDGLIKYVYEGPNKPVISKDEKENTFAKLKGDYLYCIHGSRYEHIKKWYKERIYYLDTLFGRTFGSSSTIRFNNQGGDSAFKPSNENYYLDPVRLSKDVLSANGTPVYRYDPSTEKLYFTDSGREVNPITFNFKTYQPGYVGIKWKNEAGNKVIKKRVQRGGVATFVGNVNAANQEVYIYGADNIRELGDLSSYTVQELNISNISRLSKIIIGNEDQGAVFNNAYLNVTNNKYLSEVDVRNSNITKVSFEGCTNLRSLNMTGSKISSVTLPSSGALESIYYSTQISSINLSNFANLSRVGYSTINNVNTFEIVNCPKLTGYIDKDGSIRTNDAIWKMLQTTKDNNVLANISVESYGTCPQITLLDGSNFLFLNRLIRISPNLIFPGLRGKLNYEGVEIPENFTFFREKFPNLDIIYNKATNAAEMFANYNNISCIGSIDVILGYDEYMKPLPGKAKYWVDEGNYPDGTSIRDELYIKNGNTYIPKNSDSVCGTVYNNELDFYIDGNGKYYRMVRNYNSKDLDLVRKYIKDAVQNFNKFTNIKGMFRNLEILDYLDPDTFNNIDLSVIEDGGSDEVFVGCKNLRYFEVPSDIVKTIIKYKYKLGERIEYSLDNFTDEEKESGEIETIEYKFDPVNNIETEEDTVIGIRGLRKIGSKMFQGCKKARIFIRKLTGPNKRIQIADDAFEYSCYDPSKQTQNRNVTIERPVILFEHSAEDICTIVDEPSYVEFETEIHNKETNISGKYFKINILGEKILNKDNNEISITNSKWLREVYFDIDSMHINDRLDDEFIASYAETKDGRKILFDLIPDENSTIFNVGDSRNEYYVNKYNIKSLTCGALKNIVGTNISTIQIPVPEYDCFDIEFGKMEVERSILSLFVENTQFELNSVEKFVPANIKKIYIVNSETIPANFINNFNVTDIGLSSDTKYILNNAFALNRELVNFVLATKGDVEDASRSQIEEIGDSVFYECNKLNPVSGFKMPNTVRKIGKSAFYNCSSLTTIYYSENLTEVPDYTFFNCSNLTTVRDFSENINNFGLSCFENCKQLVLLKAHNKNDGFKGERVNIIFNDDNKKDSYDRFGFDYFVSDNIRIGDRAFFDIGGLIEDETETESRPKLTITDNIKYIGTQAFYQTDIFNQNLENTKLTEFIWKQNTEIGFRGLRIESEAFYNIRVSHSEMINGKMEFLPMVIYLPEINSIGKDAFFTQTTQNPFELTLCKNKEFDNKNFVNSTKKMILGFDGIADITTSSGNDNIIASDLTARYIFSVNRDIEGNEILSAYLYKVFASASLLNLCLRNIINKDNKEYYLKEVLSGALEPLTDPINKLYFEIPSNLDVIESNVLVGPNVKLINTIATYNSEGITPGIPHTLTIETSNNLKDTTWYQNLSFNATGFITLGRYLIGANFVESTDELNLDVEAVKQCDTIYDAAFMDTSYKKVKFGNNFKYIYSKAFYNSKLDYSDDENFELPSEIVAIENEAFYGCKFKKLFFPKTITKVGRNAFHPGSENSRGFLEHLEFADGCKLESVDPVFITAEKYFNEGDNKVGINITLKTLIIPASMSGYFATGKLTGNLKKYSQITNLYLGNIERDKDTGRAIKTDNIPLYVQADGSHAPIETDTRSTDINGNPLYTYKFFNLLVKNAAGLLLTTTEKKSYCPYGDYTDPETGETKHGYRATNGNIVDITNIRQHPESAFYQKEVENLGLETSGMTMVQIFALVAGFSNLDRFTLKMKRSQASEIQAYLNVLDNRSITPDIIP